MAASSTAAWSAGRPGSSTRCTVAAVHLLWDHGRNRTKAVELFGTVTRPKNAATGSSHRSTRRSGGAGAVRTSCRLRSRAMRWTVHGETVLYDSPWVALHVADVELPDGRRLDHHLVRMPAPAAGVVVIDPERGVLLLWRHRFITDSWGWEIPAGRVEAGESPSRARPVRWRRRPAGGRAAAAPHLVPPLQWPVRPDVPSLRRLGRNPDRGSHRLGRSRSGWRGWTPPSFEARWPRGRSETA